MNKEDFKELTNYVFSEPYSHLDYDTNTMEIKKKFNLLNIEK